MYRRCMKMGFLLLFTIFSYAVFTHVKVKSTDAGNSIQLSIVKKMDAQFPKIPHRVSDHIYFSIFDGKNVYTNQDTTKGLVVRPPFQLERKMFEQVRVHAINYLKREKQTIYLRKDCKYIRYRQIPTMGMEYDVTCYSSTQRQSDRVTLYEALQPKEVIFSQHRHHTGTNKVNIILPLMGRPETFKTFLENIKKIQRQSKQSIGLTVVYFDDEHTAKNKKLLTSYQKTIKGFETQLILLEKQAFSRSKGLQVGAEKTIIKADIVFLCDVDISFTIDFFHRCQTTPVQGYQIFFPVIFSLYNPEFIYAMQGQKIPQPLNMLAVGENFGFWRLWGHGMVCAYRVDLLKLKGFDKKRTGWGGEDINFLNIAVKKKYKIVRSLEPGLFHRYHYKSCYDIATGQNKSCLQVQAMNEASKQSLGLWFYRQKYNISVYGILTDGNHPYDTQDYESNTENYLESETHLSTENRPLLKEGTDSKRQMCPCLEQKSERGINDSINSVLLISVSLNFLLLCVFLIPSVIKLICNKCGHFSSDVTKVSVYQKLS